MKDKYLLKNRLTYGFGVVGPTIIDTFTGSFLTLFATDVLGLDALHFATLLLAPKVVDVLIDFFIMYFVGKTKTRFGMYRPWLLNMIAMVIALITIFSVPFLKTGTSVMLTIIITAYFISSSICDSLYWIPYIAIPGVMTKDETELVKISSTKTIFEYAFSVLVSALTMPILLAFGCSANDYKNPTGWLICAVIFGFISLLFSIICFVFVRTDPELERKMTDEYSAKDVLHDYINIFADKKFLVMVSLLFLTYIAIYTNQTVSYYYYINNLKIENVISYIMLIAAVFTVLDSILVRKMYQKFGLKISLIAGAVSLILASICMMCANNVAMVIVMGFFLVMGSTVLTTLIFSSWPVIAKDLNPEKVKSPLNSTIGVSNVFGNFGIIFGNMLGSAIITFSKYNPDLVDQNLFTLKVFRYCSPLIMIFISGIIIGIVICALKKGTEQNENV